MALYGCEATVWPKAQGKQLGAQALNLLLGSHSTLGAPELPWLTVGGIEPPALCVLIRRVLCLGKVAEKHEGFRARFDHLLDVYRRAAARGAGPHGKEDNDGPPAGPIALRVRSLAEIG
eukprot:4650717-Alexandrium_andersonii.AAC.1